MYDAMRPPSTGAELEGAHGGAPRRNAFLPAERVGIEGGHRHALSGASITPENEQNKKTATKAGKTAVPSLQDPCAPNYTKRTLPLFGKSGGQAHYAMA